LSGCLPLVCLSANDPALAKRLMDAGAHGVIVPTVNSPVDAERAYAGGGILLDQGLHMVNLVRLFGGEFTGVKSYVSSSYWKHDVEDNAYALMRSPTGRTAILHSTATQWQHRFSLEMALTEGYVELQGILSSSKSYEQERLIVRRRPKSVTGTDREKVITYLEDNSWRDEVWEFARAAVGGTPLASGASWDALETMRLVYRVYSADPEWRAIWGTRIRTAPTGSRESVGRRAGPRTSDGCEPRM